MTTYIDLRGASGAPYRFTRVDNAQPPTAHSGVYIYVREAADAPPLVVYIAEAENLMTGASNRWPQAVQDHGATAIYTRLHVSSATRKAELADILKVSTPAMNS